MLFIDFERYRKSLSSRSPAFKALVEICYFGQYFFSTTWMMISVKIIYIKTTKQLLYICIFYSLNFCASNVTSVSLSTSRYLSIYLPIHTYMEYLYEPVIQCIKDLIQKTWKENKNENYNLMPGP